MKAYRVSSLDLRATILCVLCIALAQPGAFGNELRSEIEATPLRPNTFLITGAGGNILVIRTERAVLAVDSGLASTRSEILDLFKQTAGGVPDYVINTHWHPDHIGGNDVLRSNGAAVIAHETLRPRVSHDNLDHDGSTIPAAPDSTRPDVSFSHTTTVHTGNQTVRCIHVPTAHTDGDVFVHLVEENVIHMGDVFKNGRFTYFDVDSGGSIDGFIAAQKLALSIVDDDTLIVPGHGKVGRKPDLARELTTLERIRATMVPLIADHTLEDVQALDPYAGFPAEWAKDAYARSLMVRTVYESLAASR